MPRLTHALWFCGMTVLVLAVVLARVSVHAHTAEQCFVGIAMGAVYAVLSFALVPDALVSASERVMERVAAALIGRPRQERDKKSL